MRSWGAPLSRARVHGTHVIVVCPMSQTLSAELVRRTRDPDALEAEVAGEGGGEDAVAEGIRPAGTGRQVTGKARALELPNQTYDVVADDLVMVCVFVALIDVTVAVIYLL